MKSPRHVGTRIFVPAGKSTVWPGHSNRVFFSSLTRGARHVARLVKHSWLASLRSLSLWIPEKLKCDTLAYKSMMSISLWESGGSTWNNPVVASLATPLKRAPRCITSFAVSSDTSSDVSAWKWHVFFCNRKNPGRNSQNMDWKDMNGMEWNGKISCQASVAIWCTELTGGKSRATCRRLGHCARSSVQALSRNMKNMTNIGISYWFTLAVTKCIKMWNLETLSEASRQKFSNMCVSLDVARIGVHVCTEWYD